MTRPRTSVALRLVLALFLSVAVAVGAVAVFTSLTATHEFERYISTGMERRAQTLVPEIEDYYASNNTMEGVETLLSPGRGKGAQSGEGLGAGGDANLLITDATGRVLVADQGTSVGATLSSATLANGVPIVVNGETVGHLLAGKGAQEAELESRVRRAILYAGLIGGLVALGLGLLITQSVLRPLGALKAGTARVGQGDLEYRVPITTRDEIGEVAHQFNDMTERLEEQERLRQNMMADIAHELRTPLTVMQGHVEALRDGVFDLTPESMEPIHTQVLLLGRLVNDLRELALADAGRLRLEKTPLEPGPLTAKVVAGFQRSATEKGIALEDRIPPQACKVLADPQRLEQIVGNLLSNAIRHTPRGGRVTVSLADETPWVRLSVEDTGSGIAPEDLAHIFERFYRSDRSRNATSGGTGIGLAIAKQLVEAHGGTIQIESALAVGTTVTVRLPRVFSTPTPGTYAAL